MRPRFRTLGIAQTSNRDFVGHANFLPQKNTKIAKRKEVSLSLCSLRSFAAIFVFNPTVSEALRRLRSGFLRGGGLVELRQLFFHSAA